MASAAAMLKVRVPFKIPQISKARGVQPKPIKAIGKGKQKAPLTCKPPPPLHQVKLTLPLAQAGEPYAEQRKLNKPKLCAINLLTCSIAQVNASIPSAKARKSKPLISLLNPY